MKSTTEDEARQDYRRIAERRVRLGLVLAEIGERNNIQVSDDEVTRAVVERARQFPGQEQRIVGLLPPHPRGSGVRARPPVRGEGRRLPPGALT